MSLWANVLLYMSLIATPVALLRGSWAAMAAAAVLSLLLSTAALFSIGFLLALIPCLQVAAALALRWRLGVGGWSALLLYGVAVWAIGGPGYLASDGGLPLFFVLPAGLLLGFALLAWDRPPALRSAAQAGRATAPARLSTSRAGQSVQTPIGAERSAARVHPRPTRPAVTRRGGTRPRAW